MIETFARKTSKAIRLDFWNRLEFRNYPTSQPNTWEKKLWWPPLNQILSKHIKSHCWITWFYLAFNRSSIGFHSVYYAQIRSKSFRRWELVCDKPNSTVWCVSSENGWKHAISMFRSRLRKCNSKLTKSLLSALFSTQLRFYLDYNIDWVIFMTSTVSTGNSKVEL